MKYILAIIALLLAPVAALAQEAHSGAWAGAGASAGASAGSQSQSGSSLTYTQNNYNTGRQEIAYSGSYDITNVPNVAAPGIITAHNCALGASGGASGSGFGISFGGSYVDRGCELRAEAAAVMAVAGNKAAVQHLARDPDMCQTFRSQAIIPADSLCTFAERRAAEQRARTSTRNARAEVTKTATSAGYAKCELTNGKVTIRYTAGADKAAARAACLSALGY